MATIRNSISLDVYRFNATGNAFVRKETVVLPVPFQSVVPLPIGPDNLTYTYSKITVGTPPQDYYIGQTISELNSLLVQ